MKPVLLILNILVSILLVVLIFIQGRGGGLGSAWGGGGAEFQTRRGVEKLTMRLTFILLVVFLLISIVNFFIR